MSIKMRLARGGTKKRPYYQIVVANSRSPRDGRFIEKVGTYNPMLKSDHPDRVRLIEDRIKHWLSVGVEPTDRVIKFLSLNGLIDKAPTFSNPQKSQPKKKAQERLKAEEAAREAAVESARKLAAEAEQKATADTADNV